MNLTALKTPGFAIIKGISTLLILSSLGLECWNLITQLAHHNLSSNLDGIFIIERFIVIAHLLEATIALKFAASKGKQPLQFAIYTFFVGTVGLLELFFPEKDLQSTTLSD